MTRPAPTSAGRDFALAGVARLVTLALLLYCFFLGLELMGLSFKLFGRGVAEQLIATTSNPFLGLLIGLLATSAVQSSSTTTSIAVGMVAGGALTLEGAIPIIMGANIGTSVTNTLVSMGHVTRREEFRRAFAGATIHDIFNLLTVAVLFPLELTTGLLARSAKACESVLEGVGGLSALDPVAVIVEPVAEGVAALVGGSPTLTLIAGVGLLFLALRLLVRTLKEFFTARAETILHRTLFRSAMAAIAAGAVMTVMVQSSSITTSLMVPLLGAGIVTLEQVFPFTLGANIGTTVTAMLAALATAEPAAVALALSHLLFNLGGTLLIYPVRPIRRIPLAIARRLGDLGVRSRALAIGYVLGVFYGIPILLLVASGVF